MKIEIKSRWDDRIILCGEYKSIKDCLEKNRDVDLRDADLRGVDLRGVDLRGVYLEGVDLRDADLRDVDLRGVNLEGVDLRDVKNYVSSHDFWLEIIRRQPLETFTEKEWAIIGQVFTHRLCWDSIKKRYAKKIMPIFKKLKKCGFDDWEKYYTEVLKKEG